MEQRAIALLDQHGLMTIATLRADGWPQATMVNYANDGLLIYFLISRQSQKFANIRHDSRVSITVGRPYERVEDIKALSIAAFASELTDAAQRERAYQLLLERHPAFSSFPKPDLARAALMRAAPKLVSLIDFSRGFGHADEITLAAGVTDMQPARADDWGLSPAVDRAHLASA
jgi:general stress protein 26